MHLMMNRKLPAGVTEYKKCVQNMFITYTHYDGCNTFAKKNKSASAPKITLLHIVVSAKSVGGLLGAVH